MRSGHSPILTRCLLRCEHRCVCAQVRSLEEENRKLELNIRELCLKKTVAPHNFSRYFETINDLRVEVKSGGRARAGARTVKPLDDGSIDSFIGKTQNPVMF